MNDTNQFPQMLYKAPGAEPIHGGHFATLIVTDAAELEASLSVGWHETTVEAKDAHEASQADEAPATRAELEAKATELGIEFNHRHSDKTLAKLIDEKLAAGAASKT